MNILLIIEGVRKEDSTFSILSLNEKKLFLQFSPEFYLQDLNLGEVYADGGVTAVEERFNFSSLHVIDGYVRITVENLIALLQHFFPGGIKHPFAEDSHLLSEEELCGLLCYSEENLDENFSILHHQKYFFNLLAEKVLRKRNLLKLSSIIKYTCTYAETDVDLAYWTKVLIRYINKPAQKMTQVIFPLAQSFRMIHDAEQNRIKIIDIARNEQYLRNLFLQDSAKELDTAASKN